MTATIAALSTPALSAALGVIRVSGPDTFSLLSQLFAPRRGTLAELPARQMAVGTLCDDAGRLLDEAMISLFPHPNSYTGEDLAELYCHGSLPVLHATLDSLFRLGARPAGPGEFTERAFLNGRMDLTQAEAVIDLISAQTEQAAHNAAHQIEGSLARTLTGVYDTLAALCAQFYAAIDYPDDDIPPLELHAESLSIQADRLSALRDTYDRGRVLREGVPATILGRPNVGKSSLLNALLGVERAIVTEMPGTTRDTLDVTLQMGGLLLRLTDTAGLRTESDDPVEQLGMERSRQAARTAGLLIIVLDGSAPLTNEDLSVLAMIDDRPAVIVINKCDRPCVLDLSDWTAKRGSDAPPVLSVSALTGQGLSDLDTAVERLFAQDRVAGDGLTLTNARQQEAVSRAANHLHEAIRALATNMSSDMVLLDIEAALGALAEITGRNVTEDILHTIFSRFCVGK